MNCWDLVRTEAVFILAAVNYSWDRNLLYRLQTVWQVETLPISRRAEFTWWLTVVVQMKAFWCFFYCFTFSKVPVLFRFDCVKWVKCHDWQMSSACDWVDVHVGTQGHGCADRTLAPNAHALDIWLHWQLFLTKIEEKPWPKWYRKSAILFFSLF